MKLISSTCGIVRIVSSGDGIFTFESGGIIRMSPCASFPPEKHSSTMLPLRPLTGLLYSPSQRPTSASRLRVSPSVGISGATDLGGEGDDEHETAAAATRRQPPILDRVGFPIDFAGAGGGAVTCIRSASL